MPAADDRRGGHAPYAPLLTFGATLIRPLHGRTSLETVQVAGAGVLGAGHLVFLFATTASLIEIGGLAASWWLPITIAVVVVSGLALIAVALTGQADLLSPVATGSAIGYLGVMVAWFAAWTGDFVGAAAASTNVPVWLTLIPGLTSVALMLAERPIRALVNLFAVGVTSEIVATQAGRGHLDLEFGAQTFWSLAWAGVYLVMAAAAVVFAKRLDAARTETMQTALDRAWRDERDAEHRRLDTLVHDRIIAFLLALAPGRPDPSVVSVAAGVIDELDHWWDPGASKADDLTGAELVQRLRTVVTGLGDDIIVRADCEGKAARFDGDVTGAVLDATAEAVRNYYRHAGPSASCAVIADVRDDRITVTIADDGIGFDPSSTPAGRLGVAFGIVQRMAAVPGGSSSVQSAPGHGTRVRLEWTRP